MRKQSVILLATAYLLQSMIRSKELDLKTVMQYDALQVDIAQIADQSSLDMKMAYTEDFAFLGSRFNTSSITCAALSNCTFVSSLKLDNQPVGLPHYLTSSVCTVAQSKMLQIQNILKPQSVLDSPTFGRPRFLNLSADVDIPAIKNSSLVMTGQRVVSNHSVILLFMNYASNYLEAVEVDFVLKVVTSTRKINLYQLLTGNIFAKICLASSRRVILLAQKMDESSLAGANRLFYIFDFDNSNSAGNLVYLQGVIPVDHQIADLDLVDVSKNFKDYFLLVAVNPSTPLGESVEQPSELMEHVSARSLQQQPTNQFSGLLHVKVTLTQYFSFQLVDYQVAKKYSGFTKLRLISENGMSAVHALEMKTSTISMTYFQLKDDVTVQSTEGCAVEGPNDFMSPARIFQPLSTTSFILIGSHPTNQNPFEVMVFVNEAKMVNYFFALRGETAVGHYSVSPIAFGSNAMMIYDANLTVSLDGTQATKIVDPPQSSPRVVNVYGVDYSDDHKEIGPIKYKVTDKLNILQLQQSSSAFDYTKTISDSKPSDYLAYLSSNYLMKFTSNTITIYLITAGQFSQAPFFSVQVPEEVGFVLGYKLINQHIMFAYTIGSTTDTLVGDLNITNFIPKLVTTTIKNADPYLAQFYSRNDTNYYFLGSQKKGVSYLLKRMAGSSEFTTLTTADKNTEEIQHTSADGKIETCAIEAVCDFRQDTVVIDITSICKSLQSLISIWDKGDRLQVKQEYIYERPTKIDACVFASRAYFIERETMMVHYFNRSTYRTQLSVNITSLGYTDLTWFDCNEEAQLFIMPLLGPTTNGNTDLIAIDASWNKDDLEKRVFKIATVPNRVTLLRSTNDGKKVMFTAKTSNQQKPFYFLTFNKEF